MSLIELSNLVKTFKAPGGGEPVRALDGVTLAVRPGEFISVVGPSGSGKSTLLCAIGGMQRPDAGTVRVDGTDVYRLSTAERARLRRDRVGFVFQTFNLIPFLSCQENVALPAILAGEDTRRATKRASEQLDRLGLRARLRHRPAKLSVGERQRVAIARALINHPNVVLADEPTGNLDPATITEVIDLLTKINDEGQTIVMVTHDMQVAGRAGRTVTLEAGRVRSAEESGGRAGAEPLSAESAA